MPLLFPRRSMRRSTSEPAVPESHTQRGRLYRWPTLGKRNQRHGHLTRSRPQDSASNAAAPQWEPRKPLGGMKKGPSAFTAYTLVAIRD